MTKQYEYIQKSFNNLRDISIPPFQRGLVWSKNKKKDLISTLHDGFPFGVILVASTDNNDNSSKNWQLLDGQQRLSTIIEYSNNRLKYWKPLNQSLYDNAKEKLNNLFNDKKLNSLKDAEFDKILNTDYKEFAIKVRHLGINDIDDIIQIQEIIDPIKQSINDYIDLDDLSIPIIRYTGDSKNYPRVFENLNKGGTPLNKYEIYNAAWINANIKLDYDDNSKEILKYVVDYYKNLEEDGAFELSKPADEIIEDNTINLAELGMALGKFVTKRLKAITSESNSNELGFGLLGISSGTKNSEIGTLNNENILLYIQKNHKQIIEKVSEISYKLNNAFNLLELNLGHSRGGAKSEYTNGLSTVFKTLSYFADLWELNDREISNNLKNMPAYYISDYLDNNWGSHGDERLYDYYPSIKRKTYKNPIKDDSKLKIKFHDWILENSSDKRGFSKQTKAIINMYANYTYKSTLNSPGEDDQFEHIIPKARIKKYDKEGVINLNSLGNGMILPKYLNLDKKDLTLYEYEDKNKKHISSSETQKISKLKKLSHYPNRDELLSVIHELKQGNFDYVNNYLDGRSNDLAIDLVEKLIE